MRGFLLIMGLVLSSTAPAEVLVFTDSAHPVTNIGNAKVLYLDRVEQIEKEMSIGLPGNIDEAEMIAKERLSGPEGAKKINELTQAYQGLLQAWQMGVNKVPAVVVGQYVVYGQPDVGLALSIIARKQSSNLLRSHELPAETRPSLIVTPPKPR
ncbi:MAG: TIGR03757 family integrating conjugative element protein [Azoarcus sp.]|jgi:integrating conjugative element protein (TIGR03757 family)|nr:TIGR03757 family integrating conjugative element protein [Azoarcus sp.]